MGDFVIYNITYAIYQQLQQILIDPPQDRSLQHGQPDSQETELEPCDGVTMQVQRITAVITHNDQGGAQEALSRLSRSMIQRGHDVSLCYLYKKGRAVDGTVPHAFLLEKERPSIIDYISMPFLLRRRLMRHRPDAIISFLPLANVLAQPIGSALRIPARIASQRNPVQTYSRFMKVLDWYVGSIGCYTDNILNSSDVQQSVQDYPWPYRYRTKIIPNGIDLSAEPVEPRKQARSKFFLEDSDIALVSIGRLAKQKNQAFLIQALGALKGFRLLLAGSGPDQAKLRLDAERMGVDDRVTFLGALDQSNVRSLLHAADIFALPSLYEGQSNALLEAMSAGKAIVTSDIPSNRDTLLGPDIEAGLVLPTTDPEQWIATLQDLAQDSEKREAFGQRARRRVQDFSLEKMCSAFEAVIEACQVRSKSRLLSHVTRASI